jgi:hypothetical protein
VSFLLETAQIGRVASLDGAACPHRASRLVGVVEGLPGTGEEKHACELRW